MYFGVGQGAASTAHYDSRRRLRSVLLYYILLYIIIISIMFIISVYIYIYMYMYIYIYIWAYDNTPYVLACFQLRKQAV